MKKKFALVLSGGGFKGAFQVGALEYIFQHAIKVDKEEIRIDQFDVISGVSVGSLNGAMIATNQFDELKKLWLDEIAKNGPGIIYKSHYIVNGKPNTQAILDDLVPGLNLLQKLGVLFSARRRKKLVSDIFYNLSSLKSLADNTPLLDTLNARIKIDKFNTVFKMGYVSLYDGEYKVNKATDFDSDLELNKAIVASTAMPIIWEPVHEIRTKSGEKIMNSVDGGIRNVTPLKDVIDEINGDPEPGVEYIIIVINCTHQKLQVFDGKINLLSIASRSLLEITLAEIFKNDIEQFLFVNNMLRQMKQQSVTINGKTYNAFRIKIIEPIASLGDTLDASSQVINNRRDIGYASAKEAFEVNDGQQDWNV